MSTVRVFNKNQCDENQWSNAMVKIVGSLHEKEMRGDALRILHADVQESQSFSVLGPNLASESEKYHLYLYPFASWAASWRHGILYIVVYCCLNLLSVFVSLDWNWNLLWRLVEHKPNCSLSRRVTLYMQLCTSRAPLN